MALLSQPFAPECADFGADPQRNSTQVMLGSPATVAWTPVETAAAYVVRLYDTNLVTLVSQTTTETEFNFDADLFQFGQNYSWDVSPLDADGVQLCPTRGGLLIPSA